MGVFTAGKLFFFFCKSFSLFPFGLTSSAGGPVMVPPQEPDLPSGSLNNYHLKAVMMGLPTFNTHGHHIPAGVSSGQNTRSLRKEKLLFQTKCF